MKNKTIAVTGVALAAAAGIAMGGAALANADQPPRRHDSRRTTAVNWPSAATSRIAASSRSRRPAASTTVS